MFSLQAPQVQKTTQRLPLNLSLIVDRSGSMGGNKLEYVKEAAIHVIRLLSVEDRVSVITYDDEVKVVAASQALTQNARQDLIAKIRAIRTGGTTNLSDGWFTGCNQIANFMNSDYLNRALLLTDGLANQGVTDQEELVMHAKQFRKRGITTTTFGVGSDFNQFLLESIADNGGGHFYFIEHPQQIPNYFKGELGEMLTTAVREMTLDIDLSAGVKVTALNETSLETEADRVRLFLGDAYSGEQRKFVLQFALPPTPIEQKICLPLSLNYEAVETRQAERVELEPLCFTASSLSLCEGQMVNREVEVEAAQIEAERIKKEARKLEDKGDIKTAQGILQTAKDNPLFEADPAIADALDDEAAEIAQCRDRSLSKGRHYEGYLRRTCRRID
jgi:Ca-activated chloride channel family protein